MFEGLERREAEIARHHENRARLAFAYGRMETTGQGSIEIEQRIDFGLTFIEEPFAAYCSYVNLDALGELLELDPKETPPMPIVSGMVTAWDQDDRDYYVGAWVGASVYFPPTGTVLVPLDLQPVIEHHFTFSAIAMKDVPIDIRD